MTQRDSFGPCMMNFGGPFPWKTFGFQLQQNLVILRPWLHANTAHLDHWANHSRTSSARPSDFPQLPLSSPWKKPLEQDPQQLGTTWHNLEQLGRRRYWVRMKVEGWKAISLITEGCYNVKARITCGMHGLDKTFVPSSVWMISVEVECILERPKLTANSWNSQLTRRWVVGELFAPSLKIGLKIGYHCRVCSFLFLDTVGISPIFGQSPCSCCVTEFLQSFQFTWAVRTHLVTSVLQYPLPA